MEALGTADFLSPDALKRPYELLEEISQRNPNSPYLYAGAAELQFYSYQINGNATTGQEVRAMAQRAVQLKPDMFWPYATLAKLAAHEKDFAAAKQMADRAIQLAPNQAKAMHAQAVVYVAFGMSDEAESWYLKAIEAYSNPKLKSHEYYWLSKLYFEKKIPDVDKGLAAARKAVALWPEDTLKRDFLGSKLLAVTDRYAEAAEGAEASLKTRPNIDARVNLAVALYGQWALSLRDGKSNGKVLAPDEIGKRAGIGPEWVFSHAGWYYYGPQIAAAMLQSGVIKQVDVKPSGFCCTALMSAAYQNKLDFAKMLIAKGANVNTIDTEDKISPLYEFVIKGNPEAVDYLLSKGARVNVTDAHGVPLLQAALEKDDHNTLAMTRRLLKQGADPTLPNPGGENLLMLAAGRLNPGAISLLLKDYGMDPNTADNEGHTALAVAVNSMIGPNLECARLLIEAGANPWVTWGARDTLEMVETYQEFQSKMFPDRHAVAALLREARTRFPKPAGFPEWEGKRASAAQ